MSEKYFSAGMDTSTYDCFLDSGIQTSQWYILYIETSCMLMYCHTLVQAATALSA